MNEIKNRNKYLAGIISESHEVKSEDRVECPTCDGQGEAMFSCCTGDIVDSDWARCPKCLESLGEEECYDCEGSGFLDK